MSRTGGPERVVAVARRHWISLLWPVVWAAAVGGLAGALMFLAPPSLRGTEYFGRVVLAGGAALWMLPSWSALSVWASTIYVITSQRVLMRRGLFRRRVIEVAVVQIGRCATQQGILGRLLGYGTVRLELQNGSWWTMRRLSRPADFVAGINSASAAPPSKD